MNQNPSTFRNELTRQYAVLFETPEYVMAKRKHTPETLASKMTAGLLAGQANKDGRGIENTCKALGVKHTYKAINEYLKG